MSGLTSNAAELAAELGGALVDDAQADADIAAAALALDLVRPKTPVRTGALLADLDTVVVPAGGWALVDARPYAGYVDESTGFASATLLAAEHELAAVYEQHLQAAFGDTT